jgi:hypothetical protein
MSAIPLAYGLPGLKIHGRKSPALGCVKAHSEIMAKGLKHSGSPRRLC